MTSDSGSARPSSRTRTGTRRNGLSVANSDELTSGLSMMRTGRFLAWTETRILAANGKILREYNSMVSPGA